MIRLVEVIATSADDARAAEEGGAGRVELVSDLARGGMTPPLDLVEEVLSRVRVPVRAMVRRCEPHAVDDPAVVDLLIEDARQLAALPVEGVVTGFARDGKVDEALLVRVLDASKGLVTFHRAFEDVSDWGNALASLRRVRRVDRILFNGGDGEVASRVAAVASLAREAGPDIVVIAGGGVTMDLVARLAEIPEEVEVHVGRPAREPATVHGRVSVQKVRDIVTLARR